MPATMTTTTLGIQYTPPSAPANSGNVSFQVACTGNAQNVGQLDIAPSATPGTAIPIPFGGVLLAKTIIIKNLGTFDLTVKFNGAVAPSFDLPAGGLFVYAAQSAPTAAPITSISLGVVTSPAQIEFVDYYVFGD